MSFHVPEQFRLRTGKYGSDPTYGNNGAFIVDPLIPGRKLCTIASDGLGWEHVSVHVEQKGGRQWTPNWQEMCWIKDMFWDPEDVVIQYHPAHSEYVNNHAYTLHLWRPTEAVLPVPDSLLVGLKGVNPEQMTALVKAGVL